MAISEESLDTGDEVDVVYIPRSSYHRLLAASRRSVTLGYLVGALGIGGAYFLAKGSATEVPPIAYVFGVIGILVLAWALVTARRTTMPATEWQDPRIPDKTRIEIQYTDRTHRRILPDTTLGSPTDLARGRDKPHD